MGLIRKDLECDIRQVGDPKDRVLEFVGSTPHVDRYGDIIEVEGWELRNYKKNPVFLWAHDYKQPPIGKALKVEKTDTGLVFRIKFAEPEVYPFADTIYKLYLGGYLRATSVGFQDLEREPIMDKEGRQTGWRYKRAELYELSAVPVPANPQALIMAVQKGVVSPGEVEEVMGAPYEEALVNQTEVEGEAKGVIPFKSFPLEPEDAPWDGPAQIREADVEDLKVICTWYDSEKPDVKSSYKLPHHLAENYHTVWRGVSAAMAALMGARGGVDLPEEDRPGVYRHLARHYREFDKEPPELKAYGPADLALIEMGFPPLVDKYLCLHPHARDLAHTLAQAAQDKDLLALLGLLMQALLEWLGSQGKMTLPVKAEVDKEAVREIVQEVVAGFFANLDNLRTAMFKAVKESISQDIYSLALNPGYKPQGGRPAEEVVSNVMQAVERLHHLVKGEKHND
jgi:HK97 family phage prohead protease